MASSVTEKPKTERVGETQPKPYRFTVEEYEKAAFAGAFAGRVELLNGEVVQMPAMKGPHIRALGKLNREITVKLDGLAFISPQTPVRIIEQDGEPEPDITVFKREVAESDSEDAPDSSEAFLVVEVGDTTLVTDRKVKLPLYARAGIPEAWILNLKKTQLEVYRDPQEGEYASKQTFSKGQSVAPQAFSDVQIEWW